MEGITVNWVVIQGYNIEEVAYYMVISNRD